MHLFPGFEVYSVDKEGLLKYAVVDSNSDISFFVLYDTSFTQGMSN